MLLYKQMKGDNFMEPKSYDSKIYNKNVVLLREKIRSLEENILNGNLRVNTLSDFQRVYEDAQTILEELQKLYQESSNIVYQTRLDTYFSYEKSFLKEYTDCLEPFHNYHKVMGKIINDVFVKQEWKDIVTLLRYNKVESELKYATHFFNPVNEKEYLTSFMQKLNSDMDYIGPRPEKWQDYVLIESFGILDDELKKINSIKNKDYYNLIKTHEELEKELNEHVFPRMGAMLKETKKYASISNSVKAMCKSIQENYRREVIESFSHVLNASEDPAYFAEEMLNSLPDIEYKPDYESMRTKEYQAERKKDIVMDQDFYEQLTLTSKIKYLRLLMQNIIKKTGKIENEKAIKVRIDGKLYKYPKRYQSRFEKYYAMLKELENEYERDKEASLAEVCVKDELVIDEIIAARYAELTLKLEEIISSMQFLEEEAKHYLNKDRIVSTIVDGKEVFVLETDLEKYQILDEKRKSIEAAISEIEIKYNYNENENKSYENVRFVEENEKDKERVKEQKRFWQKKQYRAHKGEQNALYANSLLLTKYLNLPEKFQDLYTNILYAPKKFVKSKKYSDQTKRKGMSNLYSLFNNITDKNFRNEKFASFVENRKEKILTSLATIPVQAKETHFIKNVRKPKKKISNDWKQTIAVAGCFYVIGMGMLFTLFKPVLERNPIVPRTQAKDTSIEEVKMENQVAFSKIEKLADQIIKIKDENVNINLEDLLTTNTDAYEMKEASSSLGSSAIQNQIIEEANDFEEETSLDDVGMYDLVYIKPGAIVYSEYDDILDKNPGKECTADITSPYKVTGICYENGVWVSAESDLYDPVSMYRALDAQGISKVGVRLVNPTTGKYIGHVTMDAFEKVEMPIRGGGR